MKQRKLRHEQVVLTVRVFVSADNGYRHLIMRVASWGVVDAMKEVEGYLHNPERSAYHMERARIIKSHTNETLSFCSWGDELSIRWQANDDEPNKFYAPRVSLDGLSRSVMGLFQKFMRSVPEGDHFYLKPLTVFEFMTEKLKAVPVRLVNEDTELCHFHEWVPDWDFDWETTVVVPEPQEENQVEV